MRRKLIILLMALSFVFYTNNAYAIMDIVAKVQSVIEEIKKNLTTVQEYQKKLSDEVKQVTQGVSMTKNCLADPVKCATSDIAEQMKNMYKDRIEGFTTIGKTGEDLIKKMPEDLEKAVKDTQYKKGQKDAIQAVHDNRKKNNEITTAAISELFAKAAVTRQGIHDEDAEKIYPKPEDLKSIIEIVKAQGGVELQSNYRITRILELRAHMNTGLGVAGLTQHSLSKDEKN